MAHERDAKRRKLSESPTERMRAEEDDNSFTNPGMEKNQTDLPNDVDKQISDLKNGFKTLEQLDKEYDKTWETCKILQSEEQTDVELALFYAALEKHNKIKDLHLKILTQAKQTVDTLINVELQKWKQKQRMAIIGSQHDTSLKHLEEQFSEVAEVLIGVYKQLLKLQVQHKYMNTDLSFFAEREKMAQSLLSNLVTNGLVVEKQPVMQNYSQRPLILKIGVQFSMTVRFLANIPEFKRMFKVKPVFDKDVEEVKTVKGFRHFDFNRNECEMLDKETDGGLIAKFEQMSIKQTKSRIKGSSENQLAVTEELHIIRFDMGFEYAGLVCSIEASSLPVVVISSTNQVPSAWASIMWWSMLSTSEPWNLSLFVNPPPLTWEQLSQVLSWQFLTVGKRGLDENQLSMLRDKIVDGNTFLVDWHKFSKNENAWIWIDGILGLIKTYLVNLWHDGHIMGFVSNNKIHQLLQEKQAGTFLLHFSESHKDGAITFSWVDYDPQMNPHVYTPEPYTKKELETTPLPHIIQHYHLESKWDYRVPLVNLYPDKPKDTVFGCNKSQETPSVDGYLRRVHPFKSHDPMPVMNAGLDMMVDNFLLEDGLDYKASHLDRHQFQRTS